MSHWDTITGSLPRKALSALTVTIIGIAACAVAVQLGERSTKIQIAAALVASVAFLAGVTRQVKPVLLFTWIVALTYNRQYFSFDGILGSHGSQGLYWIPADGPLVCLLLIWVFELARAKRFPRGLGRSPWLWVLPFLVACFLSTLAAQRVSWGMFELVRIVKFAAILLYVRCNFRRTEWWICIAALACAAFLQSAMGIAQVALNVGAGLRVLFGLAETDYGGTLELLGRRQHRAGGTMGHPNFLGPYLLLVIPVFIAVALTLRRRVLCVAFGGVAVVSLVAVGCTFSRLPWAVAALEMMLVPIVLAGRRLITARTTLGIGAVGGLLFVLALLPFTRQIEDRLHGDLRAAYDFRARYNHVAMAMWSTNPMLGVGLNNFRVDLKQYAPDLEAIQVEADRKRRQINLRTSAPVHNLYLLILSETGLLGLSGFALLIIGAVVMGVRAIRTTHGAWMAACCGLVIGISGQLLQQTMDFSLWLDPGWYTLGLMMALLVTAPDLAKAGSAETTDARNPRRVGIINEPSGPAGSMGRH